MPTLATEEASRRSSRGLTGELCCYQGPPRYGKRNPLPITRRREDDFNESVFLLDVIAVSTLYDGPMGYVSKNVGCCIWCSIVD